MGHMLTAAENSTLSRNPMNPKERTPPHSAKISRTIREIDPAEWDRLFPETLESYPFVRTIEETLGQQFTFYYVSIYQGTRCVGLVPCFVMDYSLTTTTGSFVKPLMSAIERVMPRAFTIRMLVCGSPTGEGRIGIAETARQEIVDVLLETLRSIAKHERLGLLAFKDFSNRHAWLFETLETAGFHRMPGYPAAWLDMDFPSWEAYLASLSKATRKDLKRKFSKLPSASTITLEVRTSLGNEIDETYALYRKTLEKSDTHFEVLTKAFFQRLSEHVPASTKYFLWRMNGKLVAFDLCLASSTLLLDEYIGMDYSVAYQYHLYFVTFRDIFKWCLANGIRRYESGVLNYEPKKRLDFTFSPRINYVKHTNRLLDAVVFSPLAKLLNPERFDPILKTLKHDQADAAT